MRTRESKYKRKLLPYWRRINFLQLLFVKNTLVVDKRNMQKYYDLFWKDDMGVVNELVEKWREYDDT